MRKTYPYLQESYTAHLKDNPYLENPYVYNLNTEQEKRHFLALLDDFVNQRQYINITLLDWHERPIKEIDGIISSGSITKDGSSSVRRSASLSCSVDGGKYNVDEMQMDFALNKKVFIEIGVKNETNKYPDWPILWFPQGVFYINSFSMNSSATSAVNLSLQLKDKMCLLNGDVGGKLPATVQFDVMTTQLSDGTITDQKVLYYNIITELVHHWGEEDLNNIVIQDVPLRIRRIVQWNGENPIYLGVDNDGIAEEYQLYETPPEEVAVSEYGQGDDVGYVYADFVPTSEITGGAGDTVCTILDTIKNQLGNYEYFYDVYGIFHFREIKNYLNITQSNIALQEMGNAGRRINLEEGQFQLDTGSEMQYLVETTNEKTMYSFTDAKNITSITVTPNYDNIKNDFIIEGIKKSTTTDTQYTVRYRCVIDEKPEIVGYTNSQAESGLFRYTRLFEQEDLKTSNSYVGIYGSFDDLIYYTHPEFANGQVVLETNRLGKWYDAIAETTEDNVSIITLPTVGNMDQIYHTVDINNNHEFWLWTGSNYHKLYLKDDPNKQDTETEVQELKKPIIYSTTVPDPTLGYTLGLYHCVDWRTFLYCYGIEANALGLDPGPYFQDIYSFWPNEYDLRREKQCFFGEEEDGTIHYKSLAQGNFYFDMIDASSSSLGEYSVQNIGRRIDVYHQDDINCLFRPEIPNVVFLNKDNPDDNWSENSTITELRTTSIDNKIKKLQSQRDECRINNQPWIQVPNDIFTNLITGGYLNSAYEALRYELFSHTTYQKVVSITSLPAFYLEPNSRVEVSDYSTNTHGDFMVQNISLSLGPGANMTVSLNEVSERL